MSIVLNNNYLVLEFWNTCDFNNIFYQKGFKQRMFIDSDVVKPKYEIKEEGYEDGEMNFHKTFEKERKIFKVDWVVFEYMLDSIYLIPLHDTKTLYLKNGESEDIENLVIETEWITAGVAKVTMTFTTRYALKTACCNNIGIVACTIPNHKAVINIITPANIKFISPFTEGLKINDRYIVTRTTGDKIYILTAQYWQEEISTTGDAVYVTGLTSNYYFDGKFYNKYPSISSLTGINFSTVKIKGFSLPNTFIKIYYKKTVDPNFILFPTVFSDQQLKNGILLTGLTALTSYDIKVYSYNHNCVYGYSAVSVIVTSAQPI